MRIVFMGTPDFAVPSLQALLNSKHEVIGVVTQPDRPKGRKREITPPPVKVEALKHNLPILQPEKLRNSLELETLKSWQPELIVTAAFGQLLPKDVLDLPEKGCINVHASLLPKYRGGAPIHYALIKGEAETGITIMYMAEKLDAGDIISQAELQIVDEDNVASLFKKLSVLGAQLLLDTLPAIEAGDVVAVQQDESLVTYAPNISREQEQIDWSKTAREIWNHIRGMNPFPVAYTTKEGQVIKLWQAQLDQRQLTKPVGTIYQLDEKGIGVVAGDKQGIILEEIQPSGKKRMQASEFLRGTGSHWQIGDMLGD